MAVEKRKPSNWRGPIVQSNVTAPPNPGRPDAPFKKPSRFPKTHRAYLLLLLFPGPSRLRKPTDPALIRRP